MTRLNTINVRSDSQADLELVRLGLELKEPSMDHTVLHVDLLAIQAVSA